MLGVTHYAPVGGEFAEVWGCAALGHLPRNSAAAFDINYTINRSRWHAGRPSGLGHEWVGFLFITKREPSHAMNEFPTAPPSGGADTLDGGFVYFPRVSKKKKGNLRALICSVANAKSKNRNRLRRGDTLTTACGKPM